MKGQKNFYISHQSAIDQNIQAGSKKNLHLDKFSPQSSKELFKNLSVNIQFEYFQLVIVSNNQNEMQAKEIGFYSTHQGSISIDYINQALR